MEKVLQDTVLKHHKTIWKIINRYLARTKSLTGHEQDLYQEAAISLMKVKILDTDSPALVCTKVQMAIKKGIRGYMNKFLGIKLQQRQSDRTSVVQPLYTQDLLNARGMESDDGEDCLGLHSVEQPDYAMMDLSNKVNRLALNVLTGKEYVSVYDSENTDLPNDELHRRRSNRINAVNRLKKHVADWK